MDSPGVAETNMPVHPIETYLVKLLDPSLHPEIILHRGHNTTILVREGDRKSVIKLPNPGISNGQANYLLWENYPHVRSRLPKEVAILRRLEGLDHVVGAERVYSGFSYRNAERHAVKNGSVPNQSALSLSRIPANILIGLTDVLTLGALSIYDFHIDRITGIKKEFVDGETLGQILYGKNPYRWNLAEARRLPWIKTPGGQWHHFNGTSFVETNDVPPVILRNSERQSQASSFNEEGWCSASQQYPYSPLSPDMFPWEYKDGAVYHQGQKIMTGEEIKDQLRPVLGEIHKRGVVGIDIRPPNVLISKEGKAYFFDFDRAYLKGGQNRDLLIKCDGKDLEDLIHPRLCRSQLFMNLFELQ
ncbi:MAG: hypothetical protein AABX70_07920 [Nanoarchaeota archaeon]